MEAAKTAREIICQADAIARKQGRSQAAWSVAAGLSDGGQGVGKLMYRGDCRLSTILALLAPLGYELTITEVKDGPNTTGGAESNPDGPGGADPVRTERKDSR